MADKFTLTPSDLRRRRTAAFARSPFNRDALRLLALLRRADRLLDRLADGGAADVLAAWRKAGLTSWTTRTRPRRWTAPRRWRSRRSASGGPSGTCSPPSPSRSTSPTRGAAAGSPPRRGRPRSPGGPS